MATESDPQGELRGKLMKRLAVAGALVAVLLGVLAFFDYLTTPEEPEAPVFTQPVPVPPKKELTQPVTPAPEAAEPPKAEEPPPAPPAPAAAPEKAPEQPAPAAPQPAPPRPAVSPTPSRPPAAEPAPPPAPAPAAKPVPAPAAPEPAPVPESTAAPETAKPPPKPAEAPRPALSRIMSGYVLQAGVFTNAQRAEELHAKLTLNGIPSTLEARVQVGPFKTRAEAEAAREKLKALGIEVVLIPPAKGGR